MLVNVCDRYGDQVEVSISDYQGLNPEGRFEFDGSGNIIEVFSDKPGDFEVIAEIQ